MGKAKKVDGRKLVVLSGRTKGTAFVLTKPEVNAGRESDNAICLKGKRVSRYHAVLVRDNGEYTLRDVSPHIGTLLNGRRTKEAHLKVGDRIRIGEFEFSYEAAATTAPAIDAPSMTTPASVDEVIAPVEPVAATPTEPVVELVAENTVIENSTSEHQQRIVELTQETERLVAEVKLGNEALESVRAQVQTQSDLQADLSERLGSMSQENLALAKLNSELQAKVSELKGSAEEADRVEAKLTQETKRLVGEVKKADEAMESLRAQLQKRSDQQAELTERLKTVSHENAMLTKLNSKLEAKVSKLEASAAEADRVETELATAQAALRQMSEDLTKARESAKLDVKAEPAAKELERIQTAPAKVRIERVEVSDLPADIERVVVESDEARMAAAKKREEAALAKRCVSEQTNEQFDSLRRSIVEKKNLRANMTLYERFMLPFRDTARLVQEPVDGDPE
jgi:pSer/pThr/pTyr-binding forkhead associated (FHA) protein